MVDKKTSVIAVLCVATVLFLGLWVNAGQEAQRLGGVIGELEDDYEKLAHVRMSLEENYSKLRTEKEDLEKYLIQSVSVYNNLIQETVSINKEKEELENNYSELLKTINATEVMNWTRTIPYNISAGTSKTWSFVIPKGGLIWEANIWFSSGYISLGHSWKRGDLRGNVGSSGLSLEYLGYPHQDYVAGTITCKWTDDGSGRITVGGIITTSFKEIIRDDWHSYRVD